MGGGHSRSGPKSLAFVLDLDTGVWKRIPSMTEGKSGLTCWSIRKERLLQSKSSKISKDVML